MATRIAIDLHRAQDGWFVRKDLAILLTQTMEGLRTRFDRIECFVSLDDEPCFDGYVETLLPIVPRDRIKTFLCPPEPGETPLESPVKELLRRWYLGQFRADYVCTPDYRLGFGKTIGDFLRPAESPPVDRKALIERLKPLIYARSAAYKIALAQSIEDSTLFRTLSTLFVDVTFAIVHSERSGIPRVVREFASRLPAAAADSSFRVRAVYASGDGYRLADVENGAFVRARHEDGASVAEFHDGDILFFPGLSMDETLSRKRLLTALRNRGVKTVVFLHDLFPIHYPEQFQTERFPRDFSDYLEVVSGFSGVIANSRTTLEHYKTWRADVGLATTPGFLADYVHLGCDIAPGDGHRECPADFDKVLSLVEARPTLMMVGTIAPRKNHEAVLDAMEALWRKDDLQANLVFVGQYGWNLPAFRERIENHPERWRRFLWLDDVSDGALDLLYRKASGIVYVSDDEGYGLPIVEASAYGKPILVLDRPIFREIAGDHATYHRGGTDPRPLAETLRVWIDRIGRGVAVPSSGMERYTWDRATARLFRLLTDGVPEGHG